MRRKCSNGSAPNRGSMPPKPHGAGSPRKPARCSPRSDNTKRIYSHLGRWSLVFGRWLLVIGLRLSHWPSSLVVGLRRSSLVFGRADDERQTTNDRRQTTDDKRQMTDDQDSRPTTNNQDSRPTTNDQRLCMRSVISLFSICRTPWPAR